MRKSQRRSHRRAGKFIMYTFPYKFENVIPLTFLDRFGIRVRFSVFVPHHSTTVISGRADFANKACSFARGAENYCQHNACRIWRHTNDDDEQPY